MIQTSVQLVEGREVRQWGGVVLGSSVSAWEWRGPDDAGAVGARDGSGGC